jgi:nitroreductase
MEFMQVLGSRRSVRYFEAERPVEREKIETVLQAARLASRAMNVPWGKGIVVYRDALTPEERDALKTPFAAVEFDLAPVYLLWYHDMDARRVALAGAQYPAVPSGVLQETAVYGPPHGWSRKYVERVIVPEVLTPGLESGPSRGGNADAGLALMQAYLAAVDEGLGACLVPFDEAGAARVLGVPDTWEPVLALLLGYSVESPEAGGQRPRPPWQETFFDGHSDRPFQRDPEVVASLEAAGLVQTPAPIPWRAEEVRALSRGFALPGGEPNGGRDDHSA